MKTINPQPPRLSKLLEKNLMHRQGDVLIIPVDKIPTDAKPMKREKDGSATLALGEATGHSHRAHGDVRMFRRAAEAESIQLPRYLQVRGAPAIVLHQEHGQVDLPPGNYRVIQQREYSPEKLRRVVD